LNTYHTPITHLIKSVNAANRWFSVCLNSEKQGPGS